MARLSTLYSLGLLDDPDLGSLVDAAIACIASGSEGSWREGYARTSNASAKSFTITIEFGSATSRLMEWPELSSRRAGCQWPSEPAHRGHRILPTDTKAERWRHENWNSGGNLADMSEPNSAGASHAVCQLDRPVARQAVSCFTSRGRRQESRRSATSCSSSCTGGESTPQGSKLWTGFSALAHEAGFVS